MRAVYLDKTAACRTNLEATAIKAALEAKEGVLWVEVRSGQPEDVRLLHEVFGFHHLAIEDCTNGRIDTPKIDDYGDYLFIVCQSVDYATRTERLELTEISLFLGPTYMVTVTPEALGPIDELFERVCENPHMLARGADFLAHTVIDSFVDLLLPAVEEMDEALDVLERRIIARPEPSLLSEVMVLRRNTLRLRRSILPQRDLVNRLSRGEFELINRDALMFYRDVYDHIVRVEQLLEGLRDLADGALNSYLSAVNNRMNEIMKTLSIVAAIFLPLTLIASIYGTNLAYSSLGLKFEHGFYLMLAMMAVLALALVGYFRHRGWF